MTKMINRLFVLSLCAAVSGAAWQQSATKGPPAPSTTAPKLIARPDGAEIHMPKGFAIEEFAAGFTRPRFMALGPAREVLLSDFVANGSVWVLAGKERKKLLENL